MDNISSHIKPYFKGKNPIIKLSQSWMKWAFFFFFAASIFGVLMRYFFVGEVPIFTYKHLLHAHSHLALLGWGYMLIMGYYVFNFCIDPKRISIYKWMLFLNVAAGLGMMFSFPVQGYGTISIFFSSIQLFSSYYFAGQILKDLRSQGQHSWARMVRFSIYWMLLSTLGLLAIGPVGAILGKNHPLYYMSVQWFLHLQLSGWFTYSVFGILMHFLFNKGKNIHLLPYQEWILHLSVLMTYALSVSWSTPISLLIPTNSIGVILQSIAYFWIMKPIIQAIFPGMKFPSGWEERLLYVGILSLIAKALVMALLVVPEIAHISITIRLFVVGFIHLVMLGTLTLNLGAVMQLQGWLPRNQWSKKSWFILVLGFISSEVLIFTQGLMLWTEFGFMPHYYLIVFIASLLFPIALVIIQLTCFHQSFKTSKIYKSNQIHQTSNQHMKSSTILSWGVGVFLLASCGGGGNESEGTYTPPSSNTEKTADPKGIGEIKTVDISAGIDETMANKGKAIVDMKCTACHQLNDKRIVGPGFQGITNRRRPEWIMNMITNVDVMLEEDPVAQALLEECLTRMPNQNISIGDSRDILEFMRKNDLEKTGSSDAAVK
ncbi:c-type cytochrome [Shivajiella indica]|uniref:C-type cytochrome n=1 Tax=Shivajiella indica TaxID=872115 RepID=A0ABW5B857_9BACT